MSLCVIPCAITCGTMQEICPLIKKRKNDRENEVKQKITLSEPGCPASYGDRFIPRRYALLSRGNIEKLYVKHPQASDVFTMVKTPGYWRRHNWKIVLNSTMGIESRPIYQFSDPSIRSKLFVDSNIIPQRKIGKEVIYGNTSGQDWPCKPRSRPLAFADSTHDLPGFGQFSSLNVISWSSKGQIAASFGRDLVLWTPETDSTIVYEIRKSKAIAFNPTGDVLAVGYTKANKPVLELWDVRGESYLHNTSEYMFRSNSNEVRCLEWEPTGQILLCGTESGKVYIFTAPTLKKTKLMNNHKAAIFSIKFSPKLNYIATNDIEGNVFILLWNSCEVHVALFSQRSPTSQRKLRTVMDWHPWTGTDLAISEDAPASIMIINVPTKKIVAYYQRKDYNCQIDCIVFSKISAELVVSYTIRNPDGCLTNEIVVLASLDRAVDLLKAPHDDRIRYMLWSPDGSRLATAGNDDTLTIWNFFSLGYKVKREETDKQSRESSKRNLFMSSLNAFLSIR